MTDNQHDTPWPFLRWAGVGFLVTLAALAVVLWTMAR